MESIRVHAPAKINTILKVVGVRPNGYHDLFMVMEKLSLCDEIVLEPRDSGIELVMDGKCDEGMTAEKNLAWRAANALKEATDDARGVRIVLKKNIPVAAGLGGGSSDAAATLIGLNRLWNAGLEEAELAEIGSKLGADVPFFCHEGTAVVEGIGERVTAIPKLPKMFILLVNPGFPVSTPWVYKQWDVLNQDAGSRMQDTRNIEYREGLTVEGSDARFPRLFKVFQDVTANLTNDLEEVTLSKYPEVNEIKEYLFNQNADGALMAGSGPTVFGLFKDARTRDKAAANVDRKNWKLIATEN